MSNSEYAIQTFTGAFFDVFAPNPELIRIEDIAHALSQNCRFTGHTRRRWSVAQHSLMVCDLCPYGDRLAGLLHDASEAYLSDIPSPIKQHPKFAQYRFVERQVEMAIGLRFNVADLHPYSVKLADNFMLWAEAEALMHGMHGTADWLEERPDFSQLEFEQLVAFIKTQPAVDDTTVRSMFLDRFYELTR